ncbi:MAG: hypothetical protein J6Z41_05240 [Prevotella sp.]|nr:hypothetical protein [Prevotella sp.]
MRHIIFGKMKHYAFALLTLLNVVFALTACSSDNDAFFSANENDAPRILNSDIPEGKNGEPEVLKNISRTENFVFDIIVTPADYTIVTWELDGELIHEGKSIDMPLLAGNHTLKIIATTTKGKQTSRTCLLTVRPLDTDPTLGNDIHDRLVKQGTAAKLHGKNLEDVKKIIIGGQEIDVTYNAQEKCLEYTVPNFADGTYNVVIVDSKGERYGGGQIELNTDPVYPVIPEVTLWEGSFDVTWGTPFNELQYELINHVKVGTILRAYVNGNGKGTAASAWWRNLVTGYSEEDNGRGDIKINGSMVLEFELNEISLKLLKEQQGFYMVGDGYTVTKITVE